MIQIAGGALLQIGGTITFTGDSGTDNYILLNGGYIALKSDAVLSDTTIEGFLSGIRAYDASGNIVVLSTDSGSANYYKSLLTITYYSTSGTADTFTGYSLDGYTVITSVNAVPEPATFAIFASLGALGLALRRRVK